MAQSTRRRYTLRKPRPRQDPIQRFWELADIPDDPNGCWLWKGSIGKVTGYAEFLDRSGHRFAHELLKGEIPPGYQIDHLCRVRQCVNPDHLEAVTPRENYLRGIGPTAVNARKTHCQEGHEYTPENTGRTSRGWRFCISCYGPDQRDYHRALWHRRPLEQRMRKR